MKLIGLCGTHGSGKTTLIEAFEGEAVIVKTSISAIYKKHGLSPQLPMSLDTRLNIQDQILAELVQEWVTPIAENTGEGPQIVLTDRTPADFIGYLLCEISGYGELTEAQNERVKGYVDSCMKIMPLFDAIIHVPIGLPMVKRDKVAAVDSIGYRLHLDMVLKGALTGHNSTYSLFGTDHDYRVRQVQSAINTVMMAPI